MAAPAASANPWSGRVVSEVDLVEELERILSGELDDEVLGVGAASGGERDVLLDRRDEVLLAEFAAAQPDARDAEATVADPAVETWSEPVPASAFGFWRPRRRIWDDDPLGGDLQTAPRTDMVILSALAVLAIGVGVFAAFGTWSDRAPTETAGPVVTDEPTESVPPVEAAGPVAVAEVVAPAGSATDPGGADITTPAAAIPELEEDAAPSVPATERPQDAAALSGSLRPSLVPAPAFTAESVAASDFEAPADAVDPAATTALGSPFAAPSDGAAAVATADPAATGAVSPAGGVTVTTATWVNLRSGPSNESAVITVVPSGARVEVVACDLWCEVVYEGQSGWIYQDLLEGLPASLLG